MRGGVAVALIAATLLIVTGALLTAGTDEITYGVQPSGGQLQRGSVFEIIKQGHHSTFTTIYEFCATPKLKSKFGCRDGDEPVAIPKEPNGTLFGVTEFGGSHNVGTIFQLYPSKSGHWVFKLLWDWCVLINCDDGYGPFNLAMTPNGNVTGQNAYGGYYGKGTVWEYSWVNHAPVIYTIK
jgi:uncharacterized repeat protein (TIGR03803 family)